MGLSCMLVIQVNPFTVEWPLRTRTQKGAWVRGIDSCFGWKSWKAMELSRTRVKNEKR